MLGLRKYPVAGIFAMAAWRGAMDAASADAPHESVKGLLDGIGASIGPHSSTDTAVLSGKHQMSRSIVSATRCSDLDEFSQVLRL